jgi:hypothetical protein
MEPRSGSAKTLPGGTIMSSQPRKPLNHGGPSGRPKTSAGRISRLTTRLEEAIRMSLPISVDLETAIEKAKTSYKDIAQIVVELRHQFIGPHGHENDLRGQTAAYREAVHSAYERAGAGAGGPITKRLTAGVAYWVRKILLEKYGTERLAKLGILKVHDRREVPLAARFLNTIPLENQLTEVVALLNHVASDHTQIPTREQVEAAARAVELLRARLTPVSIAG